MILTDTAKNAMLQGLADLLNIGSNARLSIYIDTTLAVELTLPNPVEASITGGVLTFNNPPQALAAASGVPTTAQIMDANGIVMMDFDAALITLDKATIYQGGYVGVQSLRISI